MLKQNPLLRFSQIFSAIDYCLAEQLILPALVLIFTAIDSIAWAASEDDNSGVGNRFQSWVNTWMLQKYPLPCTAIELYAARCGVLHTLTPNADLNKDKNIRRISYAWGTANQKDLEESINRLEFPGLVAVHVNDIYSSLKNGFDDYIESLDKDLPKRERFIQKVSTHFVDIDKSVLTEFLSTSE